MLEPSGDKVEKQLPAWKQSLIERRRLQDALEARQREEEQARLAQLPQWKREVLLRKQNKSTAIPNGSVNGGDVHTDTSDDVLPRRYSSNRNSIERSASDIPPLIAADVDASAADEERLLPLIHNPILRRDLERRRTLKPILHRIVIDPKPRSSRPKVDTKNEVADVPKKASASEAVSTDAQKPVGEEVKTNVNDGVLTAEDGEEMVYGHGFVSKLRDRFRQLTEKPDDIGSSLQPRCRSHSSDNLLDDSPSHHEYSAHGPEPTFGRKGRAYSVDNLASETKASTAHSEKKIGSLRPLENHGHQEAANGKGGKPELSTIKFVKNVPTNKSNAVTTCNVRHSFSDPNFKQNLDPKICRNTSETNTTTRSSNPPSVISSLAEEETDSPSGGKMLHESSASPPPEVNELPKPNTVMNVRTMFEKVGTSSSSSSNLAKPKTGELPLPARPSEPSSKPPVSDSRDPEEEAKPVVLPIRITAKKISASDILKDRNRGHDAGCTVSVNDAALQSRYNSNSPAQLVQGKSPFAINENGLTVDNVSEPESIQDTSSNEASKSDIANRKKLNLNLSDLSQVKSSRKAATVAMVIGQNDNGLMQNARQMPAADFSSEDVGRNAPLDYGDEYDGNGIPYSSYSEEYFDDYGTDDDLSDYDDDDLPREGDPTVYRRRSVRPVYEFEGAGVIVERSLLAKSKNGGQRKIVFDDDAISTHEYPSERLLHELHEQEDELVDGSNGGYTGSKSNSYHVDDYDELDSALTSYKSRSVVNHYVIGQSLHDDRESHDKFLPPPSEPTSNHDTIELRPVDSESVTWSNEATSDLLF